MVYSRHTWVDNTNPPLNASNLNEMEVGILEGSSHSANRSLHISTEFGASTSALSSNQILSNIINTTTINSSYASSNYYEAFSVSSENVYGYYIRGHLRGNTLSGLCWPPYPSAAVNKSYVDTISGNLVANAFDETQYITSSNAINRFAGSSNINRTYVDTISGNLNTKIGGGGTGYWKSSSGVGLYYDGSPDKVRIAHSGWDMGDYNFQVSGDAYFSGQTVIIGNDISGLRNPPLYPSSATSKAYVDGISGNLRADIGTSATYTSGSMSGSVRTSDIKMVGKIDIYDAISGSHIGAISGAWVKSQDETIHAYGFDSKMNLYITNDSIDEEHGNEKWGDIILQSGDYSEYGEGNIILKAGLGVGVGYKNGGSPLYPFDVSASNFGNKYKYLSIPAVFNGHPYNTPSGMSVIYHRCNNNYSNWTVFGNQNILSIGFNSMSNWYAPAYNDYAGNINLSGSNVGLGDIVFSHYTLQVGNSGISGSHISTQSINLHPRNNNEPDKNAGVLWASSNATGTYCPLYYMSTNNGSWKKISFT